MPAVPAVVALMRWQDRRQARFAARASVWTARAEALPPWPAAELPHWRQAALGLAEVHLHLHAMPDAEQIEVVCHTLGTRPVDSHAVSISVQDTDRPKVRHGLLSGVHRSQDRSVT